MNILQNLAGMKDMTEQVIATDFLLAAKSSVQNYGIAISETTTPEVREVLRRHLDSAINTHEVITKYMIKKGYYNTQHPKEQIKMDMKSSNNALELQ